METTNWPLDDIWTLLGRRGIRFEDHVLLAEVGSTVHGINVSDQDDLDLTLVRVEPWYEFANAFSFGDKQSAMVRTKPDGERSMPGDLDINVYTVRKFAKLMASGNPSIMTAFFSPKVDECQFWLDRKRGLLQYSASQRAGQAFKGYMKQQLERWVGERGQKNVNRPELVEKYGFDTKYAGHIVRLGLQGIEFMETGKFSLPMDPDQAELIRGIRTGKYTQQEALDMAYDVEDRLLRAIEATTLPANPNMERVHSWVAKFYEDWYT